MPKGLVRCKEDHAWATPSHDLFDFFPPLLAVAMDGTTLARPFLLTKTAVVEAVETIPRQLPQGLAEEFLVEAMAPIDHDHQQDDMLLILDN